MTHSQLVDQLAAVKSLLVRVLQDFLQLEVFLAVLRGAHWHAVSLGLVEKLLLHVKMLLQVIVALVLV